MRKLIFVLVILFLSGFAEIRAEPTEELWNLYSAGRYPEVIAKADLLLQSDPENIELNLMMGRALADMARYEAALPFLNKANTPDKRFPWVRAWALDYLGRCYYAVGQTENSRQCLEDCIALRATRTVTRDAEWWLRAFGFSGFFAAGPVVETPHFIFHFQKSTKVPDIQAFAEHREQAFETINSFFGSRVPRKIDYFVYNSDRDMVKLFSSPAGFALPPFCIVHARHFQTVGHEMTHIISYFYGQPVGTGTPLISEGIAVYFDLTGQDKLELARQCMKQNRMRTVSIRALWNDWNLLDSEISYPLAGAFVKFLIDREGPEKFKSILSDQRYENARKVYGSIIDQRIVEFESELATGVDPG